MEDPSKIFSLEKHLDTDKAHKIRKFLQKFVLTEEKIKRMMTDFEGQMKLAYSKDEAQRQASSVLNENTYIYQLLDGRENGDFLGLDLGGSNFRVVHTSIKSGKTNHKLRSYRLPDELLEQRTENVFDFVCEKIASFLQEEKIASSRLPLGFTFSFPMRQKDLTTGYLVTWTKSFKCPNGPGEDIVNHLEEAIKRRGDLPVDVVALLCDTTATLIAGNGEDPNCRVGLIIGTGCNASFVEQIKYADKVEIESIKEVLIDIQWGSLGDNGCIDYIKTDADRKVDAESNHPNSYAFEKLIAGLYLGEIVRHTLIDLTKEGLLFDGKVPGKLDQQMSFTTTDVCNVERDQGDETDHTRAILRRIGVSEFSPRDVAVVREVCAVVSTRAAQLVAANLAVMLEHMDKPAVTIAIDGSVYEHHPNYHSLILQKLGELVPQTKVTLTLCKEGSGKGAALTAAIALKQKAAETKK